MPTTWMSAGGIAVEVERKRVKNLNLRVRPDGTVHASVPIQASAREIATFLDAHRAWMAASIERMEARGSRSRPTYRTGEHVRVWGGCLSIALSVEDARRRGAVRRQGNLLSLVVGPGMSDDSETALRARRSLVERFLRSELVRELGPAAAQAERSVGEQASEWRIRRMRTRWGSCSIKRRRIWINLELATQPRECLDYVCVHEACHLVVPNHGPAFYALMDEVMPGWKQTKALLDGRAPLS